MFNEMTPLNKRSKDTASQSCLTATINEVKSLLTRGCHLSYCFCKPLPMSSSAFCGLGLNGSATDNQKKTCSKFVWAYTIYNKCAYE